MSMKNKFVTAVTTAGLLATIFGSSAMAAGRPTPAGPDTTSPKAKYTTVHADGATAYRAGTTSVYGVYSAVSNKTTADDGATFTFRFFSAGANNAGTTAMATADLKAVSSNSNIVLAWARDDAGAAAVCEDLDYVAAAGGDPAVASKFVTTDIVEGTSDDAGATAGLYTLCVAAKTSTTAATGTITVSASEVTSSAASWVTMKTITVTAIGPVASLALSLTTGYKYVAAANSSIADALTIVGKDANGTVLNGATGSITAGVEIAGLDENSANPEDANGNTIDFLGAVVAVDDEDSAFDGSERLYTILADVCDAGNGDDVLSDIGKSYSLAVAVGEVVSNSVSITCTGTGAKAVIKSVAAEVTSFKGKTYDDGKVAGDDMFDITATVVDENGLPLGNGSSVVDFGAVTMPVGVAALGFTDSASTGVEDGKLVIAGMEPVALPSFKAYKYSIKVADSDLATTDAVAKTFALTYTISNPTTITVKMNAAKTVATVTVNFGEDAADESAYLEVETTTGSIKTYRKIANASGVATWTVALRKQQVFMTADSDVSGVESSNLAVVTYK